MSDDFNPRPREKGDFTNHDKNTTTSAISIHALVKRATGIAGHDEYNTCDFNPRPREKGDFNRVYKKLLFLNFNPRPREKGDVLIMVYSYVPHDFNPRPREKGD